MGSRLQPELPDVPKGFLKLGDKPIVEESVLRLERAGIQRIVVVTGYGAGHYEDLAGRYDGLVELVHNPDFGNSGSMYSLYCARDAIDDGFVLLESDLIYESRALDVLVGNESPDAVLVAGPSDAGDEVYVETRHGLLVNMSKDRAELGAEIAGELVGISKISQGLYGLMVQIVEQNFPGSLHMDYEVDCLVLASSSWPIPCPLVPDLLWAEIDDANHLERARRDVYPRLALDG